MDNYSAFTDAFYHESLKFLHDYFTSEIYLLIAVVWLKPLLLGNNTGI